MTNQLFPPDLNNPVTRWADSTLRVMDATLSSVQSVGDGIDRVTRAAANAPVTAAAVPAADSVGETASPGLFSLTLAVALQRSALELMTKGWLQWMSMMGTVAGAAARRLEAPSPADETPAAKAASRRGSASADVPATSTRHRASGTRTTRKQQEQAGHTGREHAFAQSEPKRKRGTKKAADAKKRARASAAPRG